MAKKPTLSNIINIPTSALTINSNNEKIEIAFENTLSLDGSTPNAMQADLDMNSNDILNAGVISAQSISVQGNNLQDLAAQVAADAAAAAISETNAAASKNAVATDAAFVAGVANNLPDPRGIWLTATAYNRGDIITINGGSEICLIPHTSSVFTTDKSNGRWQTLAEKGNSGAGTGDMLAAQNLNDLVNKPTARTNLGLGSMATQVASAVAITGGTVTGITDLAVADGGTGASDAPTARSNLGAQAQDVFLDQIAALTDPNGDRILFWDDSAGSFSFLTLGAGLSITNTTITAGTTPWTTGSTVSIASGTTVTYSGIPATATEIVINVTNLSLTTADNALLQLLDAGVPKITGYNTGSLYDYGSFLSSNTGFILRIGTNARIFSGHIRLRLDTSLNVWRIEGELFETSGGNIMTFVGFCTNVTTLSGFRISATGGALDGAGGTIQATYR